MKTAKEIISQKHRLKRLCAATRRGIELAINEAMVEVIKECAAICGEHMDSECFDGEGAEANILNLIKELQ